MYVMSRQAHFIEVEVDTETGEILVTNAVCVKDVGHLFNRRGAEAQQYGGAIMGLGRSATEENIYCPRTGVGLNFDNIGYHIGTMNDYPDVQCIINESHLSYSSFGACGIGDASAASMSGITAGAMYIMQPLNGRSIIRSRRSEFSKPSERSQKRFLSSVSRFP